MASASTSSLSISSPPPSSPPQKRLSKIFSGGRRSSDAQRDADSPGVRDSLDSLSLDKTSTLSTTRSPSREDGSRGKSGSAAVKKLIPGHAKRERKRIREEELKIAAEEASRGRSRQANPDPDPDHDATGNGAASGSPQSRPPMNRSASSLFTEDSELDTPPPLISRESHTGYLTTTSPFIKTTPVAGDAPSPLPSIITHDLNDSTEQFPSIVEPQHNASPSPRSSPVLASSPVSSFTGLIDKADALRPTSVADHKRGKSPARRFKDVFSRGTKSARTSPERLEPVPNLLDGSDLRKTSTSMSFSERRSSHNPDQRTPSPLRANTVAAIPPLPAPRTAMPVLQTDVPKTPPSAILQAPETTITPPTPVDSASRRSIPASPVRPDQEDKSPSNDNSNVVVSQSGNMISHRRVRSASSTHQKSKLSVSQLPPLTPTIEEIKNSTASGSPGSRNVSVGGGFFSSWVSAAQNAASTFTVLTGQNRSRSGTGSSDPSKTKQPLDQQIQQPEILEPPEDKPDSPKKQLAVETLGAGDLNLAHLGIENGVSTQGSPAARSLETEAALDKEQVAAKIEDLLAKRAVSQAYERIAKSTDGTPVAEIPDPLATARPGSVFETGTTGTLTPPNGSIFEGNTGGGAVQRSNSVRSKLQNRRSRGSSAATGQSVLGAMIGASTATLANPAGPPRLSGFAMAPKQRNRAFHQQFRSVPEDDYLIEDYSCALQKDILLAGRLYISEGHICFSSNILGWVTTLIISFEEVVSVEKENTAIVIPNAIAVQTLHARHTFRSLLSREATYDLMIGIWRVSHPDSFNKSMNHKQLATGDENKIEPAAAVNGNDRSNDISEEESDEDSNSSGSSGSARSLGSSGSVAGSEFLEPKALSRKPSGIANSAPVPAIGAAAAPATADATASVAPVVGAADAAQDFLGPPTHAPTDCTDKATHYDKVLKDEIIPAPLGKIYSLLYGPQSGAFCRKFLEDGVSKAQDLQLEDDKKGLNNEIKSRQYRYIKPLGGSIGPKQTNCITTENLDFFDLEKAVSVTCTTQTPDVPSGSAFNVKTRYCLTWAPNDQTRFQMNMTIEWTAKSWLKGPIEKGALDGQTQYGDDLVKTLKASIGRNRAPTTGSKVATKGSKKRKKSSKKDRSDDKSSTNARSEEDWGIFDFARPLLGPIVAPLKPILRTEILLTVLTILVLWTWIRPSTSGTSLSASGSDRFSYYNDLWARQEDDLWEWLEDRAGVDRLVLQSHLQDEPISKKEQKEREKQRKKLLKSKDVTARMREEKKSIKEMEEAVRITQERLDAVRAGLDRERRKSK